MSAVKQYIFNEVKVIENECLEKGIYPAEWIDGKFLDKLYEGVNFLRLTTPHPLKKWNSKTKEVN